MHPWDPVERRVGFSGQHCLCQRSQQGWQCLQDTASRWAVSSLAALAPSATRRSQPDSVPAPTAVTRVDSAPG